MKLEQWFKKEKMQYLPDNPLAAVRCHTSRPVCIVEEPRKPTAKRLKLRGFLSPSSMYQAREKFKDCAIKTLEPGEFLGWRVGISSGTSFFSDGEYLYRSYEIRGDWLSNLTCPDDPYSAMPWKLIASVSASQMMAGDARLSVPPSVLKAQRTARYQGVLLMDLNPFDDYLPMPPIEDSREATQLFDWFYVERRKKNVMKALICEAN